MKYSVFFTLTLLSFCAMSQAHNQGTLSFNLDYDAGANFVLYDSKYENGGIVIEADQDTSGAITHMGRLDGHFNLFRFLSVGGEVRFGSYVENTENEAAKGNDIFTAAISARFYPVNKDKFTWYVGTSYGFSTLEINRELIFVVAIPYQYKFGGNHFVIDSGFNFYFSENVGLNFNLGYTAQKFKMNEYSIDGDQQDLSNYTNILRAKGAHFGAGLTMKFGG